MNIKTGRKYRNRLGAELTIGDPAWVHFKTLGGDGIWIARAEDSLFGPTDYLVTAESLALAGYAPAGADPIEKNGGTR